MPCYSSTQQYHVVCRHDACPQIGGTVCCRNDQCELALVSGIHHVWSHGYAPVSVVQVVSDAAQMLHDSLHMTISRTFNSWAESETACLARLQGNPVILKLLANRAGMQLFSGRLHRYVSHRS